MMRRRKGRAFPTPSSLVLLFALLVVYAVVSALLQQKSFSKLPSSNEEVRPVWKKSLEVQLASLRDANLRERTSRLSSGPANTTDAKDPPEIPPRRRYFHGRKVVPTTTRDDRPPLSNLLQDDGNITGDVQFLLDFAIVVSVTLGCQRWRYSDNTVGAFAAKKCRSCRIFTGLWKVRNVHSDGLVGWS
jgi:hypothetical protein